MQKAYFMNEKRCKSPSFIQLTISTYAREEIQKKIKKDEKK